MASLVVEAFVVVVAAAGYRAVTAPRRPESMHRL